MQLKFAVQWIRQTKAQKRQYKAKVIGDATGAARTQAGKRFNRLVVALNRTIKLYQTVRYRAYRGSINL